MDNKNENPELKLRMILNREKLHQFPDKPDQITYKFGLKLENGITFDLKIQGNRQPIEEYFNDFDWAIKKKNQIEILIAEKIDFVKFLPDFIAQMDKMEAIGNGDDISE